jgi:hypothetical protein
MSLDILPHHGRAALGTVDTLVDLYRAAFCAPPWNEPVARAEWFGERLETDARRPGFVAVTAHRHGRPVGFGTADDSGAVPHRSALSRRHDPPGTGTGGGVADRQPGGR